MFWAKVRNFEREFALFCGAKHNIGLGNGLNALHMILRTLRIGTGDEVIVPANTFIATWLALAVSYAGAKVVPIEPNNETYNIDFKCIESAISSRTRAINELFTTSLKVTGGFSTN